MKSVYQITRISRKNRYRIVAYTISENDNVLLAHITKVENRRRNLSMALPYRFCRIMGTHNTGTTLSSGMSKSGFFKMWKIADTK